MYRLVRTSHFERRLARFARIHTGMTRRVAQVLRDLELDPFQPHLRLYALSGELTGLHAVRVTYTYRITMTIVVTEREIVLHDIGSHDEVYG